MLVVWRDGDGVEQQQVVDWTRAPELVLLRPR
jgi:hypothetical protein